MRNWLWKMRAGKKFISLLSGAANIWKLESFGGCQMRISKKQINSLGPFFCRVSLPSAILWWRIQRMACTLPDSIAGVLKQAFLDVLKALLQCLRCLLTFDFRWNVCAAIFTDLLCRFLTKYLDGVTSDTLKIGLWAGALQNFLPISRFSLLYR